MARVARFRNGLRDGGLVALALIALGLASFVWLRAPTERPIRLRMSAGRAAGERSRIAEVLRREAARRGIAVELVETAGTEASLRLIEQGKLDAAFAQGGLDLADRPSLRQAATLHVEPLHLLVKREIHDEVAGRLSALRGKLVGLGEQGTGTGALAAEVLEFVGLEQGDYRADHAGYADLLREPGRDRLPDAVFMVSTLPSPVARHLVRSRGFRLVPLPFVEAFTLGALDREAAPAGVGWTRVDRRNVYPATIPAYAYEFEPGVPPGPIPTIGARLLVIARHDVPSASIRRLLDVMFNSPFAQALQPTLDARSLEVSPELPWHDGTVAYQRRNAPMIAGDAVDLVEKELSIVGVLVTALFFLGQWARRRYRRRRDRSFEAYILRVADVERRGMAQERAALLDLSALLDLQEELGRLKAEAMGQFADGELDGEELMSGFLAHVSDTRDYLTRLILHRRDALEKQARREGRGAEDLWDEALAEGGGA